MFTCRNYRHYSFQLVQLKKRKIDYVKNVLFLVGNKLYISYLFVNIFLDKLILL